MSGSEDFAAALAQSLAATPADEAATTGGSVGKTNTDPAAAESSSHPAKKSDADAAPDALTLLENALAGVLAAPPGASMTANASAVTAGSGTSTQSGQSAAAQSTSSAPASQLIQTLAADAKAAGTTSALVAAPPVAPSVAAAAAASAATAGAVTAALTAAQLTAGSSVAPQQTTSDPKIMTLSSPVGSSAWTDELSAKVTWMAHQGIQSASLQLSPEHLGPLQVSISVHNGQASVWFGAAQPDTRTALQQSLPQLRQLFANQGLALADAGVSREPPRGQSQSTPARHTAAVSGVAATDLDGASAHAQVVGGLGLIDTYA